MKTIQEQSNNRKQEIIQTVNKMFDEMDYQDISMKTISEHISISRPALYCYYNSKEEIMLDILKADYLKFISDITNVISNGNDLTKDITNIYLSNIRLLKIVSTYLTDIETHVSIDCLVEFKKPFVESLKNLEEAFTNKYPSVSKDVIKTLINSLLMLTHGLYPMIYPTNNQVEAMKKVGMNYCTPQDTYSYCYNYLKLIFSKLI